MRNKLQRTKEQWEKCDPEIMSHMSQAAIFHALALLSASKPAAIDTGASKGGVASDEQRAARDLLWLIDGSQYGLQFADGSIRKGRQFNPKELALLKKALSTFAASPVAPSADAQDERGAFEADYAKVWNADLKESGWNGDHAADDVKALREGNTYGEGRDYLNARWEGWQARAALQSTAHPTDAAPDHIGDAAEKVAAPFDAECAAVVDEMFAELPTAAPAQTAEGGGTADAYSRGWDDALRYAAPKPVLDDERAAFEPLLGGIQKLTDTDRLDFIEAQGIDYSCPLDGSTSAWIAGMTVVEEPEPGEKPEFFNLRRAIDFAMRLHKKRNTDDMV